MSDIEIIWLTLYNTLNRTEDKKMCKPALIKALALKKKMLSDRHERGVSQQI